MKGRININRMSGGGTPDEMRIEVIDASSRIHFLVAKCTPEAMMLALTGRGDVEIEFELVGAELIGSEQENKTEEVPFDCYKGRNDSARKRAALKPFEVDGWKARVEDLDNGHCRVDKSNPPRQKVVFHRWVNAKTGKPVPRQ